MLICMLIFDGSNVKSLVVETNMQPLHKLPCNVQC